MPIRGAMFPDITPTEYDRQPEILQTRIPVPFGDPLINQPHPLVKNFFSWNSVFLTAADLDAIEAWFRANGTTFFSLYEADGWKNRAIARTVAATIVTGTMTYTLPGKELTGLILYDNGAFIDPSRYTVSPGTGTEGETRVTFVAGQLPANGRELSFTATSGRVKYTVWLVNTRLPSAFAGEGDLFTFTEPLRFEEKIV